MEELKTEGGWPDRYRPEDLEHVALSPTHRERLVRYLAVNALPRHLILYGSPGFGKTTVARIIAKKQYRDKGRAVMSVNAADTGNVDYIRDHVIGFMRMRGFSSPNLLIFEEATGLSREGAAVLRVPMEKWADNCTVMFLTNDLSKLDAAVQSRCDVIEMGRPPIAECGHVLQRVLETEGVHADAATVLAFTREHFAAASEYDRRDLRSLLAMAQHCVATKGSLPVPPEPEAVQYAEEIWQRDARSEVEAGDGAWILNDLASEFSKYLSLPLGGVEALVLWTVFAWAHEAFSVSPILALLSPTPRAGKSTVFEMLEQLLIPETHHPSSLTPAVLFRLKGRVRPAQAMPPSQPEPPTLCLLMDEADNWLGLREELRAVLNSGHTRRSASVLRMVSTDEVGQFSSWYPKAVAMIDRPSAPLPESLRDRSILIPMQRKRKEETLPKLPRHRTLPELRALRDRVALWVRDHFLQLRDLGGGALLSVQELNDRARDNWQPLMVIARVAGGGWEERARRASGSLSGANGDTEALIDLIADIKEVFDREEVDTVHSVGLVRKLQSLDGRPWMDMRLTAIKLSKMLRPVHIRPRQLWTDAGSGRKMNKQGYAREQFEDAFARYL